ncbi:MAG TPA: FmdB family zinc ribbon protein [Streptosporangiaceae bacterium]
MPTYQYACTSCGEQLEAVQRFSDDPLTVCPACGGALRKVFSPVGIVFKGSGFYRTDSRNGSVPAQDKDSKDSKESKDSKSSGDSSSSDKKAAKPAADSGKKSGTKSSQPASAASSA